MNIHNEDVVVDEFSKKYTKSGAIGSFLIDRFFRTIQSITADLQDIDSIHEVACGAGFSTSRISEMFPISTYDASDLQKELTDAAQKHCPGVQFSQESLYELKGNDAAYDLVIALEVLEHLDDPTAALKELHRITKRYALISVPREPLWRVLNCARGAYLRDLGNTPGHINHWSARSFQREVEQTFEIIEYRTPTPWTVVLAKPRR